MAAACKVQKRTYCNYESGESEPRSSFFEALADAGGDAVFVLTGRRSVGDLAPDEAALIDNYRNASRDSQSAMRKIGAALAEQDDKVKSA